MIFHEHHIIPKHAGGTDESKNKIVVNIPLHAFLHKLLWEKYNNKYDYIAWQVLSDNMTKEAARLLALKEFNEKYWTKENRKKFGNKLKESWNSKRRQKISKKMKENNPMSNPESLEKLKNRIFTKEHRLKISNSKKGQGLGIKRPEHSKKMKELWEQGVYDNKRKSS